MFLRSPIFSRVILSPRSLFTGYSLIRCRKVSSNISLSSLKFYCTHLYNCEKRDNEEQSFLSKKTTWWQNNCPSYQTSDALINWPPLLPLYYQRSNSVNCRWGHDDNEDNELCHFMFFKKVKRRYDSTAKLWRELPTDANIATKQNAAETNQEVRLSTLLFVHLIFDYPTFWLFSL